MCYEIKVSLERQLKVARKFGDKASIDELEQKLLPLLNPIEREYYRISGFAHPNLFIFYGTSLKLASWGLVPHWIRTMEEAEQIRNKTLNARIEEIDNKPSFREAFKRRRAVLFVDGFYEHQHKFGKTFPYFIRSEKKDYLSFACIYEDAGEFNAGLESFSIVTRSGMGIMKEIHNNPKLPESRMPLLLTDETIFDWLNIEEGPNTFLSNSIELHAHTVRRSVPSAPNMNAEKSAEPFIYPELQKGLFDD